MSKKLSKQSRTLIILLVALAALVAVYIGVKAAANAREEKERQDSVLNTIYLADELETPTKVTFGPAGEENTFVISDGVWQWEEDADMPITQQFITRITEMLPTLAASRDVGMENELSDYGLEEPLYTLTAEDGAGTSFTLYVGNSFSTDSASYYYVMEAGGETVYTIESTLPSYLGYGVMSMITKDSFTTLTEENVDSFEISDGTASVLVTKTGKTDILTGNMMYTWYIRRGDTATPVSQYKNEAGETASIFTGKITDALSSYYFSSCTDFKPTEEELKTYGLDTPVTITFYCVDSETGDEEVIALDIGAQVPNGSGYYASLSGSSQVCVMTAACAEAVINTFAQFGE